MRKIVIVGESWVYFYDAETKQQPMEWRNSPPTPKKFCLQILKKLWGRREKLSKGALFLQDIQHAYKSHVVKHIICDLRVELLQHTPYSPDLAPSDYNIFPHLKKSFLS